MLEWLFGSSSEQVDPYSEKVEEAMQKYIDCIEAQKVKYA